jgi:type I restriction enzyme M protein
MKYDQLQQFDIVLANPPYSTKSWDQAAFTNDPYGRNIWGTPPQGYADYAFQQHIMKSLKPDTGRCVVLWPHGILFRDAEREMRRRMIESDCVDCVIGLGPNLFYNSPMEACLLICRMQKPANRRGKILFINAVDEVKRDKTISTLEPQHIDKIFKAYKEYKDIAGFAKVVSNKQILENGATLNISQYVSRLEVKSDKPSQSLPELLDEWERNRIELYDRINEILDN